MTGTSGRIVVGVDGSAIAAAAVRWAVREGARHGWPVRAVMAWDYLNQHHADGATTFDPDYRADDAARAVEAFVRDALRGSVDFVTADSVLDLPAQALLDASAGATMLVVGSRGMGGFEGLLIGSVSRRCLHAATCPVVVVRDDADTADSAAPGPVVVGVDASPASIALVEWAATEAAIRQTALRVVHAARSSIADLPLPDPVQAADVAEKEAHAVLEQAVGRALIPTTVRVQQVAAHGSPAKALLAASADADLLVIGRGGHGVRHALGLGSVAAQLAQHAPLPLAVVPHLA